MKRSELSSLTVYVDGGCLNNQRANGGKPECYGSFAVQADPKIGAPEIVKRVNLTFPELSTNNQAEYASLIGALKYVADLQSKIGAFPVRIFMDSALVVNQVAGSWKVKEPTIRALWREATELYSSSMKLEKLPREQIVEVLGH